jgi:hypothetical protein
MTPALEPILRDVIVGSPLGRLLGMELAGAAADRVTVRRLPARGHDGRRPGTAAPSARSSTDGDAGVVPRRDGARAALARRSVPASTT